MSERSHPSQHIEANRTLQQLNNPEQFYRSEIQTMSAEGSDILEQMTEQEAPIEDPMHEFVIREQPFLYLSGGHLTALLALQRQFDIQIVNPQNLLDVRQEGDEPHQYAAIVDFDTAMNALYEYENRTTDSTGTDYLFLALMDILNDELGNRQFSTSSKEVVNINLHQLRTPGSERRKKMLKQNLDLSLYNQLIARRLEESSSLLILQYRNRTKNQESPTDVIDAFVKVKERELSQTKLTELQKHYGRPVTVKSRPPEHLSTIAKLSTACEEIRQSPYYRSAQHNLDWYRENLLQKRPAPKPKRKDYQVRTRRKPRL